ncbi:RsbT co-antagonist protein rsbRD N-terminal domain-containing protein [Stigmatella aurantiaca]|uniref:histidine kinase n=1 Tax=Stigmatella aurantiaca TaxID=41 RepID=A0A1H7ZPE6_STIAU|nr:RsbT co-antagonist protein rsbRD N-terminal domain-containing protein [Stigmatella aurantiaca]
MLACLPPLGRGGGHAHLEALTVNTKTAIELLAQVLDKERERVARLWAKRLREELYEVEVPGKDLRAPLRQLLDELVRLLQDRGEDALRLWPEVVRSHGAFRYDQRFEPDDLAREFKALASVLMRVYVRCEGELPYEVADLINELTSEAGASAQASYARVLRTESVRFREAAVMESVLYHVEVGILLAEVDGGVSFATQPVSRLLGVPIRSVVGGRALTSLAPVLAQVNAHHPGGEPFRVADMPFMRALKEQKPVRGVMMDVERPGGGVASLEMSATPIWEEGGELAGVIQTFSDRTEATRKSRELSTAQDELRRLQGQLLQRTRAQSLGQLASGAAHALNNFLNVVRLRVTLLRREFKPEHLDALDRTVGQIGGLVSRLQEFNVQRTEEHLTDVELDTAVREALELMRGELERGEHPLEVTLQLGAPGTVRADAGFLRELVVTLLLSARDRMAQAGRLTLTTQKEGTGELSLRIQDEGPPFPVESLAQLFDPLTREAGAPQSALQLAVVKDQVRRWGGELTVENVDGGKGGTFVVRLPRAREAHEEALPAGRRMEGPRRFQQTRRVLVVDDDLDNARMMAEVLGEEGYDVQLAQSAEVALQLWERRRYDAALLDAVMPDVSGWELARELRQRTPHALLAIVTGMDVRGQNRSTLALVDAVFRKPIDMGALDEFLSQSDAPEPSPPEDGPGESVGPGAPNP